MERADGQLMIGAPRRRLRSMPSGIAPALVLVVKGATNPGSLGAGTSNPSLTIQLHHG